MSVNNHTSIHIRYIQIQPFSTIQSNKRMSLSSINNCNQRCAINKTCTFNQPIIWLSLRSRQSEHFTTRLFLLWLSTLRTSMTFLSTVVTSHNSHSAIISHMPEFSTLETLLIITLALLNMMSHLTTLVALNGSTRISPTRPFPPTRPLVIPVIWFATIHLLLSFLISKPTRIRPSISKILFHNPTTIHQIRKLENTLISDTLLNLITKTVLKLDTFRKFSFFIIVVLSIVLR